MNARVTVSEADLAQARREVGWTDHRIKVAIALFKGGLSDSQCASLLGGVTRNAIIGKRTRLGVFVEDTGTRPRQVNDSGVRRGGQRVQVARAPADKTVRVRKPVESPPPPIVDLEIAESQRRSLIELDNRCCHWPVGEPREPGFFFCGASKPDDESVPYCKSHMWRAHDRRAPRRDPDVAAWMNAARVNDVFFR